LPGATPGIHVESVSFTAYTDIEEAVVEKEVSNLKVIDDPSGQTDVVNYLTHLRGVDDAKAYTDSELAAHAADATKTLRAAQLRLGNMWVVSPADTSGERFIVSGGEISGDGELVGTTNEFVISKNDYPLLSFSSSAAGVYITNFNVSATSSNTTITLGIATNGVSAAPYAEWSTDLVVGEWARVLAYDSETYPTQSNGTYTLEFTLDATNAVAYYRAMQPLGASVASVKADEWDFEDATIKMSDANGVVWLVTMTTNGTLNIEQE
jgi:hypothetical protein